MACDNVLCLESFFEIHSFYLWNKTMQNIDWYTVYIDYFQHLNAIGIDKLHFFNKLGSYYTYKSMYGYAYVFLLLF